MAVQPNHAWTVPVKSRNKAVTATKNSTASVSLIFLNISFSLYLTNYNFWLFANFKSINEMCSLR